VFLLVSDLIEEGGSLGGFFERRCGEFYQETLEALIVIGAIEEAEHLRAGRHFYFGNAEIPKDQAVRGQKMRPLMTGGDPWLHVDEEGARVEEKFWESKGQLSNKLAAFAKRSGLLPANDVDEATQH